MRNFINTYGAKHNLFFLFVCFASFYFGYIICFFYNFIAKQLSYLFIYKKKNDFNCKILDSTIIYLFRQTGGATAYIISWSY